MPDWSAFKREAVLYYAELARDPAWKAYVKKQCEDMGREMPHQFGDMTELVRKELEKKQ